MPAYSTTLVALQFILIGFVAWPSRLPPLTPITALGAAAIAGAIILALWALAVMRLSQFSVMPEPRAGQSLVERGPYARLRHPMYSAVLLGGFGAALIYGGAWKWACALALVVVMLAKLRHEEKLLSATFAGYANYRQRTGALLPRLGNH